MDREKNVGFSCHGSSSGSPERHQRRGFCSQTLKKEVLLSRLGNTLVLHIVRGKDCSEDRNRSEFRSDGMTDVPCVVLSTQ